MAYELGFTHEYHEVPETGHSCRTDETLSPTVLWLLKQSKVSNPDNVSLVVHTLRHNKSEWVAVEQQIRSGKVSRVEARRVDDKQRVHVQTDNAARLQLGPLARGAQLELQIDDTSLLNIDLSSQRRFVRGADGD